MEPLKDRIIERACTMFFEQGVRAVRMDDIAHSMGISKRTLYESFNDKEELLYLSIKHFNNICTERHTAIAAQAPNVVISLLDVMFDILKESAEVWRVFNALRRFYPKIHSRLKQESEREHGEDFKRALEIGIEQGYLKQNLNLDLSLSLLRYMSSGVVHNAEELTLPEGITIQEAFQAMFISFLRGMSTAKGIELIDSYIEE